MTSSQEFVHIYLDHPTYNQRNHTIWLLCAIIAVSVVIYSWKPDKKIGIASGSRLTTRLGSPPIAREAKPVYFVRNDAETRENKRGIVDNVEFRLLIINLTPSGMALWLGCPEMP